MKKKPIIIAHRGDSYNAPENTLSAFNLALKHELTYFECDVQLTKDEIPVIIHDNGVARTTNASFNRLISNITYEEIKELDAGSWFGDEFAGEHVPTFDEVVDTFRGKIGMMFDIKEDTFQEGKLADAIKKVLDRLHLSPLERECILLGSSHAASFEYISKILPDYHGIAIVKSDTEYESYCDLDVDHWALMFLLATEEHIGELQSQGKEVWSWTIDKPLEARLLIEFGIDGIITNDPTTMMDL